MKCKNCNSEVSDNLLEKREWWKCGNCGMRNYTPLHLKNSRSISQIMIDDLQMQNDKLRKELDDTKADTMFWSNKARQLGDYGHMKTFGTARLEDELTNIRQSAKKDVFEELDRHVFFVYGHMRNEIIKADIPMYEQIKKKHLGATKPKGDEL